MTSEHVGIGGAGDQLKEAFVVIPQIRTLKSLPKRVTLFVTNLVRTLLLTADEMHDIGFEIAPEILNKGTIYGFGVIKRIAFVVVFIYLFQKFYIEYTRVTRFVALNPYAGGCFICST